MLCHFAKIPVTTVMSSAMARWLDIDKYTFSHLIYNARCLAHLLLASITEDFQITIIGRIDQDLCNDGPLILWAICNNIYQNNITFVENIKSQLCKLT